MKDSAGRRRRLPETLFELLSFSEQTGRAARQQVEASALRPAVPDAPAEPHSHQDPSHVWRHR